MIDLVDSAAKMNVEWSEIRRRYRHTNSPSGMLPLVLAIEASPYARGLFPWTSHWDLCIAQTPAEYPYRGPFLRISPNSSGWIEFRYVDTPVKEKQWHRKAPAADAFKRLELFFEHLHWFVR